jgi:catechol 2,3-dioxygenase-like lactoylglutathione lyase family enzyme
MHLYMTEVAVSHFPTAVAWYSHLFSTPASLLDDANGFALFEPPGGRVALKVRTPAGGSTVHLKVDDLTAELVRLAFTADVKASDEGYRRAKLADADGNVVVLFEWV